ncbi:MAG: hypothetical protein AAFQ42_03605 [Pseudomonadota bacterium]
MVQPLTHIQLNMLTRGLHKRTAARYAARIALMVLALAGVSANERASIAGELVCEADWSTAGPIVRAERLTPVEDIRSRLDVQRAGRPLRVQLCRDGTRWLYRITVVRSDGEVRTLAVDAREGAIISDGG